MNKAKCIMVQGTASNAGKSVLVAGLCRIFRQDGYSVAPFKSQNMALNSFITADGLEMGRAQVAQAEAAGVEPDVLMNPILLKPTGDAKSQVIVKGEVLGDMSASEYYGRKTEFVPVVRQAYEALASKHDIIVIEGAGSPAEINLMDNDIVNMGMAAIADAPVLLVGDIDRGGVFASVYGTILLLPQEDQARIRGIVINKFRGDVEILRPGLTELERLTGKAVLGVVPWLDMHIDDEDSLSSRLSMNSHTKPLDIAIIRFPRISNFTDFAALEQHPFLGVRYVERQRELGSPDLIILPGSKNTMSDLAWLRQNGLEAGVKKHATAGRPVIGICGGFQMLGTELSDPDSVEQGGNMRGMGILPMRTVFDRQKTRTRATGTVSNLEGYFSFLSGASFDGYEIHMGKTAVDEDAGHFSMIDADGRSTADGAAKGAALGTYIHGVFDNGDIAERIARQLSSDKGIEYIAGGGGDFRQFKEQQYNLLAGALRNALDMDAVYKML